MFGRVRATTDEMSNEILYVLLPDYAEHEPAFLAAALNCGPEALKSHPRYVNRVVALTMEPVRSCGGFRTLPDYTLDTAPRDYAALILIGGFGWQSQEALRVIPLVKEAMSRGRIVGAICNAASFLARHGFLNIAKHTGNGLEQLKLWGGSRYENEQGYLPRQAVRDGNLVTANGTGYLEFARELLLLLEDGTAEEIEMFYRLNKEGFAAP